MADKKISQLTGASTPLAGSEVLPVVQGGATVKVSVDNLTAGKAVSGASFSPTGATVPANGMYLRAANVLGLSTNSAQAVDIDASGNVGVNITNQVDHGKFVVSNIGGNTNGAITLLSNDQSTARLRLFNFGSGGRNLSFVAGDPGADNTGLTLYDNANTRNVLRVDNSDNFTVSRGNFIVGTAGKGIDFSANGGDILTQYDEGTWDPVVQFGVGNTGMTFSTKTGTYTRIGRLVTIHVTLVFTAKGSSTGNFRFSLPFTSATKSSGTMGFNYAWATMPSGGITFMTDGAYAYAMAANLGSYMNDTYFNDVTAINAITITYPV